MNFHNTRLSRRLCRLSSLLSVLGLVGLTACGGGGGTPPAERFTRLTTTVAGASLPVIVDNQTGLTWATQPGTADGRRPTVDELMGLVALDRSTLQTWFPALLEQTDPLASGNLESVAPGFVWSTSFNAADPLLGSLVVKSTATTPDYVEWKVYSAAGSTATPSFALQTNGTVTSSGLMWKLCSEGATVQLDNSCDNQQVARTYAQVATVVSAANSASFAGVTGWRLPTRGELQSLLQLNVDPNRTAPLWPAAFNADQGGQLALSYWTQSQTTDGTQAWQVSFEGNGGAGVNLEDQTGAGYVRLVRNLP